MSENMNEKKKILVVLGQSPVALHKWSARMPTADRNLVTPLTDIYDVFACGEFYDCESLDDFSGTFYLITATIKPWHPRPYLYFPDNSKFASYKTLSQMDRIISLWESVEVDCNLLKVPALTICLPVDFSFFKNIPTIEEERDDCTIVLNRFLSGSIYDIARVILSAGFKAKIYDYEHVFTEENKVDCSLLGITVKPRVDWYEYASAVLSSFGAANLHLPLTSGNVAPITAWGRSICVGFPHPYQKFLYPSLTSWDISELRDKLLKLRNNPAYYEEVAAEANERLYQLSLDNPHVRNRIKSFVREIFE